MAESGASLSLSPFTELRIGFGFPMTAETLSGWVSDPSAREVYVKALGRSDFDGMLAYYKQNYPDPWDENYELGPVAPPINIPTLMFHGLKDTASHSDIDGTSPMA